MISELEPSSTRRRRPGAPYKYSVSCGAQQMCRDMQGLAPEPWPSPMLGPKATAFMDISKVVLHIQFTSHYIWGFFLSHWVLDAAILLQLTCIATMRNWWEIDYFLST